ncbi:MAG: TonB-dependent receptor plug domain-containing protein [Verrucomicrobia bacterium]|nr:TonB-dependent receptor plug domain-containing protein [Verrucomicrobiota bacterium]
MFRSKRLSHLLSTTFLAAAGLAAAAESEVPRVLVEGSEPVIGSPALPEVEGTRINSGKKTSSVRPEALPAISNNDYRQVFTTTPGLLISEEPTSPIINIGYRGLDSQRSEAMQVLRDGVSIKNEQFGFPESHYTPILDSLERVEFIRAGAALQFGSQPGGAVNFITKMPRRDVPFSLYTKNLFGSYGLYQNYTSVEGTVGPLAFYAYYDHRQRDGFRATNGDYDLNAGSLKLVYDLNRSSRLILTLDAYDEEHGEPGGLRRRDVVNPPNSVFFDVDRNASTRFFDRFRLKRNYAVLEYQKEFSAQTRLEIKAFGGYLSRYSQRQRGGDVGVLPSGSAANTNSIQLREAWSQGAELRLRHDYALAGNTSTFTGGLYFYHATQDREDSRGATPNATSGTLRNLNDGFTWNGAIFAENRFHFGRLSLTPGVRLEFLQQGVTETFNITRPNVLNSSSDFSFVPLFSLGVAYTLVEGESAGRPVTSKDGRVTAPATPAGPPRLELYGTVAQAYRPRTYGELVPTSATGIVNGDLKEGNSLQFELGLRGKPLPYLNFDLGFFYFNFNDQVGDITLPNGVVSTGNVGNARHYGFEAAAELDVLALAHGNASPWSSLSLHANVTLLDAKYTSGPSKGFRPAYSPRHQIKTGAVYRWKYSFKLALLGNVVAQHYADANNTYQKFIPAYAVWDLTAEYNFAKGRFGVFGGINNLFDRNFYAEVRDEGILPAARRNYFVGLKARF